MHNTNSLPFTPTHPNPTTHLPTRAPTYFLIQTVCVCGGGEDLVHMDSGGVTEAKEGVVGEDALDAHRACMHQRFVAYD